MAEIRFVGNVGKDAELRHTQSGTAMLTFSAAESRSRKLDDGSWEKLREQWFNVTLFGPAGEALQHHILKGARVEVAGEFWRRDYESQQGAGTSLDVKAIGVNLIRPTHQPPQQQSQQGHFAQGGNHRTNWSGASQSPAGDPWGGGTQTQGDAPPPF